MQGSDLDGMHLEEVGSGERGRGGVLILLLIIILPPLKTQLFRVSIVITKSLPWKKRTKRKMEGKDKRICYTWLALFLVQKHFLHSFLLPACQLLATLLAPFDILIHISVWHEVTNMHCEVNRYGQREVARYKYNMEWAKEIWTERRW